MNGTAFLDRAHVTELQFTTEIVGDPALRWESPVHRGYTRDWFHVSEMVDRVGSADAWTFLVIADDERSGRYAQCCGLPGEKLAVEIGVGSSTELVVPANSVGVPLATVSRSGWIYKASPSQLHSRREAVGVMHNWVVNGCIDSDLALEIPFERRGLRKQW